MAVYNANQLRDFTLEISDREIYNDIRAECDVTEILTVRPDATPEYFETFELRLQPPEGRMDVGETVEVTESVPADHIEIVWLDITRTTANPETLLGWPQSACEELGGYWKYSSKLGTSLCMLPASLAEIRAEIISRSDTSVTVEIENLCDYAIRCSVYVGYMAVTPETRYIKLRSTDEDSIAKYGRRAMDLVWPLGIAPNTMQSLIDNYCERYCEPACLASMTLEGETDTKIDQILNMRIDDKHEIIHPGLDMDEEFFVNNISVSFNREGTGILTGIFGLEQVRDMEKTTFFILDVSQLDSAHVLGG